MPAAIRIMARSEINEGSASMCQKKSVFSKFCEFNKKDGNIKMLRLFRLEKSVKNVIYIIVLMCLVYQSYCRIPILSHICFSQSYSMLQ